MTMIYIFLFLLIIYYIYNAVFRVSKPTIYYQKTKLNEKIMSKCNSINTTYHSPFFLPSGDFLSVFAALLRKSYGFNYDREKIEADDGATLNLDWLIDHDKTTDDSPVFLVLPGLTGHSHSSYLVHIIDQAYKLGWKVVVFVYPGTDYTKVSYPRFIRSHVASDMEIVSEHIKNKYPRSHLIAIGYSMGACMLTKYLGTVGENSLISAAISCSNPWDVYNSSLQFKSGFIKPLYNKHFLNSLKRMFFCNEDIFRQYLPHLNSEIVSKFKTVEEFDEHITIKIYGFPSAAELYKKMGCVVNVKNVKVPTLVAHAQDDPIVPMEVVPIEDIQNNKNIMFMLTKHGGHTGWIKSTDPLGPSWFDTIAIEWFQSTLRYLPRRDLDSIPHKPIQTNPLNDLLESSDEEIISSSYSYYTSAEGVYEANNIKSKKKKSKVKNIFEDERTVKSLFREHVNSKSSRTYGDLSR